MMKLTALLVFMTVRLKMKIKISEQHVPVFHTHTYFTNFKLKQLCIIQLTNRLIISFID